MQKVSFVDAEQALAAADAAVSMAEGHGCLCGALCTLPLFSSHSWLQELLPDPTSDASVSDDNHVAEVLVQLHEQTVAALQGDQMEFAPLLLDDTAPIHERVAALAQWAQGFLYGFGLGAPTLAVADYPGDVAEVLSDLSEIARANDSDDTDSNDQEQAYAELVEYLRAAVQMVHDELAEHRAVHAQQQALTH